MTEGTFMPDIEDIMASIGPKTRGLVVNSPSNPTGGVMDRETFDALCDIAEDHDLWIISDEVYEDFLYDGAVHHSFNERIERAVVLNSFSKSLAVPGWRLGYLTASAELVNEIAKMQYHLVAAPPTPQQYALAASFHVQQRFLDEVVPLFDRRRALMAKLLNEIDGFQCPTPRGAFYAFPSYDMPIPSHELAMRIVKAGVIAAPGTAFGAKGEGHLRFSYAASEESIVKGLEIVKKVVEGQGRG
jgi:aspartate aminotransferase